MSREFLIPTPYTLHPTPARSAITVSFRRAGSLSLDDVEQPSAEAIEDFVDAVVFFIAEAFFGEE